MIGIHKNEMRLSFPAKSENESLARMCVAAFAAAVDPTVADLDDVRTAVSEAVTNAIIHGYDGTDGWVGINCSLNDRELTVEVCDEGVGIADVKQAREPLFTTKPELERSGMGFTVMEAFMDGVDVDSEEGRGTRVVMRKQL